MPKETIKWNTPRRLPKVNKYNCLSPFCVLAEKVSATIMKPFHPVLFVVKAAGQETVVSGRFFNKPVEGYRWYSVQGVGYANKQVTYWAEMPVGPNGN